jgi:gas vesicle protein
MTGIREEAVEQGIVAAISPLSLAPEEIEEIREKIKTLRDNWDGERDREIRAVTLELGNLRGAA